MRSVPAEEIAIPAPDWYFVSDLHLFARRSLASQHQARLEETVESADTIVLGGDIFDFRWSTHGHLEHSVQQAIDWLRDLLTINDECQFVYLLGNHDCQESFVEQLDQLAQLHDNLQWHATHWRVGDTIFLHGDVADRTTSPEQLLAHREQWSSETIRPKSNFRQGLYDRALQIRLHKLVNKIFHRPVPVARRILRYLEGLEETEVRNVYFGHTHAPLDGFEFAGVRFFNGGAPLRGVDFRILQVETTGFEEWGWGESD